MEKVLDLKDLNKEQLAAVRYNSSTSGGPLLIIAGAGTGKTTVITERIKYLIEKRKILPSEILALTFTEKAAREMEERVDIAMPYGYTQMWISTFHSFCDRVLRAEALHIGLDPRYRLMSGAETIQFTRNNLFKFKLKYFRPLGNPTKFIDGMLKHFSRLQDEDIVPLEYLRWTRTQKVSRTKVRASHSAKSLRDDSAGIRSLPAESKEEIAKWNELSEAYKTYDELKVKNSVMDYGDLIVKTLHLFRKRKNILNQYKKQFKHMLVDEFQDTNFAQNELAILLAGKGSKANITVTGDDDQSVYRFRGAAISNIIQFRKVYPKAKVITLAQNYRSTQEILDRSYDLIQHNNPDRLEAVEQIDKKLKAVKGSRGEEIKFIHTDRVENEAEGVAKEITKLVKEKYNYKDFAILVRANNHAEPFIRALQRHNVPYQFLGPGRLFKQPEVIDLVSYLRVLYNFEDSISFYRVLAIDHFKISARELIKISNYAKRKNQSLFESSEQVANSSMSLGLVSDETRKKIKKLVGIIKRHFKLVKRETAGQLLYYFLEDTKLITKLLNPDTSEAEKKAANISKLFDKLKTYEVDHEDATVTAVVDWIDLVTDLGESPLVADSDWTEVNAVNILTAHSAKGLEFSVVFLVNLVSQRFPTVHRREQIPIPDELIKEVLPQGDYHVQEERRLFYVGMTRAKERLYFAAANYYGEGKREKKLSSFIFEALGDKAVGSEKYEVGSQQLTFLDYKPKAKLSETLAKEGQLPLHIDYLSYSQISTFKICPLHYKLRYIIKIPTPPSAALSFGISIHEVMNDFYKSVATGSKPTSQLMYKLLEANWINDGYKGKSHEKEMYDRGKAYLKGYLKHGYKKVIKSIALEQSFVLPLEFLRRDLENVKRPLKIGGKIDRIDKTKQGIEIVDYKTGERVPTQKDVDKDEQLTFYALAASRIKQAPFGVSPKYIKLSLYYFEEQVKITTTRTKEQLIEAEKQIFKWRNEIETSDFKCSKNYLCRNCEYKLMCDAG